MSHTAGVVCCNPLLLLRVTIKSAKHVSNGACMSAHASDHGLTAAGTHRTPGGCCKSIHAARVCTRTGHTSNKEHNLTDICRNTECQNAYVQPRHAHAQVTQTKEHTSQRLHAAAIRCTCSHVSVSTFEVLAHTQFCRTPGVNITTHKPTVLLLVHCAPLPPCCTDCSRSCCCCRPTADVTGAQRAATPLPQDTRLGVVPQHIHTNAPAVTAPHTTNSQRPRSYKTTD
jgi:hypothetical protein